MPGAAIVMVCGGDDAVALSRRRGDGLLLAAGKTRTPVFITGDRCGTGMISTYSSTTRVAAEILPTVPGRVQQSVAAIPSPSPIINVGASLGRVAAIDIGALCVAAASITIFAAICKQIYLGVLEGVVGALMCQGLRGISEIDTEGKEETDSKRKTERRRRRIHRLPVGPGFARWGGRAS